MIFIAKNKYGCRMIGILIWQFIIATILVMSRFFSHAAMMIVACFWTAWTLLAVWESGLIILQLCTVWGTVWVLSQVVDGWSRTSTSEKLVQKNNRDDQINNDNVSIQDAGKVVSSSAIALLRSAGETLDKFNENTQRQVAKMHANADFEIQLYRLTLSVNKVLEIAEERYKRQCELDKDPVLAELYEANRVRLEALFKGRPKSQIELQDFNCPLLSPSELPVLAVTERVTKLNLGLEQLAAAIDRVEHEKGLLQEIEKLTDENFKNFLLTQRQVLFRHIEVLSSKTKTEQSCVLNKPSVPLLEEHTFYRGPTTSFELRPSVDNALIGNLYSPEAHASVGGSEKGQAKDNYSIGLPNIGQRRKDIEVLADELGIPHLVHFTRCENLSGILKHGLASIAVCKGEGISVVRNDMDRFDGKLDGISLSIAFPNYLMFYKYRKIFKDADWAVLLFSPRVMWEKDCAFYRYNAADARVSREAREKMQSLEALRDMFSSDAGGGREDALRRFDPTDPQAEILVFETIQSSYIEAVAFETREVRSKYLPVLGGLESFYAGPGKGLFGTRLRARVN